jgi:hypothetical protein
MDRNKADTRSRLQEILQELEAINLWDREFILERHSDAVEVDGWKARRLRLAELKREFLTIMAETKTAISDCGQAQPSVKPS